MHPQPPSFSYEIDHQKCVYRKFGESCLYSAQYGYCCFANCPRRLNPHAKLPITPREHLISIFGTQYVQYFEDKAKNKPPIIEGTPNVYGVRCPYCNSILRQSKFEDFFICGSKSGKKGCNSAFFHINYLFKHIPKGLDIYLQK